MSYLARTFDDRIIDLLKNGAVGLLPSDTIYGLSCRALDQAAVEQVYELKGRQQTKPLIVLISNLKMLDKLGIEQSEVKVVKKYWPGSLSVICNAPTAPSWLSRSSATLAIRWPADDGLCKLIDKTGPLVSTSANPEGESPAKNVKQAQAYFHEALDFYVDHGDLDGQSSTLAQIVDGRLQVVRPGAVRL